MYIICVIYCVFSLGSSPDFEKKIVMKKQYMSLLHFISMKKKGDTYVYIYIIELSTIQNYSVITILCYSHHILWQNRRSNYSSQGFGYLDL